MIEGTSEQKTSLSDVTIEPADYVETISVNIYHANIKNSSITFSQSQRKANSFNLENTTLDRVNVYGRSVKGSVIIKNNIFNNYSYFQCYDCDSDNDGSGSGELIATGNKFNIGSQFNIGGTTRFKKGNNQ